MKNAETSGKMMKAVGAAPCALVTAVILAMAVCSDKTGTLTLMEMMVASAVTAHSSYRVTGDGYASEGQVLLEGAPAVADAVLKGMGTVSALCNDSELRQIGGVWKVEGDPTEAALYPFATKLGQDRHSERDARRRIDAIPFESEHKFMATLHEEQGGGRLLLVKGAPEVTFLNGPATGLALMLLLALGTFVAGVHVSTEIAVLGIILALTVTAMAWLKQSGLLLVLIGLVIGGFAIAFRRPDANEA